MFEPRKALTLGDLHSSNDKIGMVAACKRRAYAEGKKERSKKVFYCEFKEITCPSTSPARDSAVSASSVLYIRRWEADGLHLWPECQGISFQLEESQVIVVTHTFVFLFVNKRLFNVQILFAWFSFLREKVLLKDPSKCDDEIYHLSKEKGQWVRSDLGSRFNLGGS